MKKKGLTLDEHKQYGKMLKQIYADSMQLSIAYGAAYPKNKRVNQQLWKLYTTLVQVISEADNELFSDHPHLGFEGVHCYYGTEEFNP